MMTKKISLLIALSFISGYSVEAAVPQEAAPTTTATDADHAKPATKKKKKRKVHRSKKGHAGKHTAAPTAGATHDDAATGHTAAADTKNDASQHSSAGVPATPVQVPAMPTAPATTH